MPFQVLLDIVDIVDIVALSVVNTIGHYFVRLIVSCFPFFTVFIFYHAYGE